MDQYCAQKMFDELQKAGGKASMETVKLAVCGTTCTMAIITDDDIVIANVGDSRSILFSRKDLRAVLFYSRYSSGFLPEVDRKSTSFIMFLV